MFPMFPMHIQQNTTTNSMYDIITYRKEYVPISKIVNPRPIRVGNFIQMISIKFQWVFGVQAKYQTKMASICYVFV